MAKGKSKKEEEEENEEEDLELLQVDVGDMVKVKQVLDEAVASAILNKVQEDYAWDNIKLSIMAISCVFAMIAQFAPIPFPESRPVLGICGTAYFILSGILQLITTFIDKDCILLTKKLDKSENKEMTQYGLRIRSNLPRFSEFYTVIIQLQKEGSSPQVEETWSIGKFFDKEGYFDEVGLMQEIEKLFTRFESQRYDATRDEKKKQ